MKMMLKFVGYIFLYFVIFTGVLVLVMWQLGLLDNDNTGEGKLFLWVILVSLIVIVVAFLPYLNFAMKRSFVFEPTGEVLPEEELRREILAINDFDVPVMVEKDGAKLLITWKYVDGEVLGLLEKHGLNKIYQLLIKFDTDKKAVVLTDILKSANFAMGVDKVNLGFGFTRGYFSGFEVGKTWGVKENFTLGQAYEYKFDPSEIKTPVLNTILRNGWRVRFAMW